MKRGIKKKSAEKFPTAKIREAVKNALPKGKAFTMHYTKSSLGDLKIIRVVTPTWKSLRPSARIFKVLNSVNKRLTDKERGRILRVSVLTPEEYKQVVPSARKKKVKV